MAASTDIKWFRYTNKGAPQVTNNWGVIIPVLDACLVSGFSEQVVIDVSITGKTVKLTYDTNPGYYNYQVITVSGSNSEEINGDFRIIKVSDDGLSYFYELEVPVTYTNATGYVTTKLTPLGWEKSYEGVDKAAYRSTNESLNTRPYLRVLDGQPSNYGTETSNYMKFARVGIVEEMTSIDNLAGVQAPYDATLPNKNWDTTMVGATAYPGWAKWIYGWSNNYSTSYAMTVSPSAGDRDWILIGDSDRFYFFVNTTPATTHTIYRMQYGFGAYDTFIRNDYSNTFLFASNDYRAISTSKYLYYMVSAAGTDVGNGYHIFLQRNYSQIAQYSQAVLYSCHITYAGAANAHAAPNSYATVVPFPCYIRDNSSYIRGNLPNFFWLGQTRPVADLVPIVNNKDEIMLPVQIYGWQSSYKEGMVMLKVGDV